MSWQRKHWGYFWGAIIVGLIAVEAIVALASNPHNAQRTNNPKESLPMSNIANQSQVPIYSAGSVTIAGGNITAHKTTGRVTAGRTSAGVTTLTTQDELPGSESLVFIQEVGATGSTPELEETSNTVKTIRTFAADGTTATDKSYKYIIFTLPVAQ